METVVDWVLRHELDEAGIMLEQETASRLAFGSLLGILNTEDRERASIFSAAADALDAYSLEAALDAAKEPNFHPAAFVSSGDTIYIHAPAEEQAAAPPLVCGLLAEIRRATYQTHRNGQVHGRVLFALDEAANIAPLEELPQIASEGGGQGLTVLAAFQDLSQARQRWGHAADGFLTLFGTKLILPGVADTQTLEAVSTALGEYDRQMVATGTVPVSGSLVPRRTRTVSTQRTRITPGEVANIPGRQGTASRRSRLGAGHPHPRPRDRTVEDDHRPAGGRTMSRSAGLDAASTSADICGHLGPSTPCAWSVLLSTGTDCNGRKEFGC
ncbi:MAG: TraG/TraD/VirD4 family protein [Solirubrobacteraceae bacterium]